MDRPASDFNICPSCGTEFGYSDSRRDVAELRADWIEDGAPWRSTVITKPETWNAYVQLFAANLITLEDFTLLAGIELTGIYGMTEQTNVDPQGARAMAVGI